MARVLKILLAEDRKDVRETLVLLLADDWGHAVKAVASGKEAIAVIADGSCDIDLIITDNEMPGGVSGEEVVREAKRCRPGTPVVAMTGRTTPEIEALLRAAGADYFFAKPLDFDKLERIIKELSDKRPESGGAR